jgi:hypothetical protein
MAASYQAASDGSAASAGSEPSRRSRYSRTARRTSWAVVSYFAFEADRIRRRISASTRKKAIFPSFEVFL